MDVSLWAMEVPIRRPNTTSHSSLLSRRVRRFLPNRQKSSEIPRQLFSDFQSCQQSTQLKNLASVSQEILQARRLSPLSSSHLRKISPQRARSLLISRVKFLVSFLFVLGFVLPHNSQEFLFRLHPCRYGDFTMGLVRSNSSPRRQNRHRLSTQLVLHFRLDTPCWSTKPLYYRTQLWSSCSTFPRCLWSQGIAFDLGSCKHANWRSFKVLRFMRFS